MKIVVHPPIDPARLAQIREAAGPAQIENAASTEEAGRAIVDADAFIGKITPELLRRATRLRWVQAPTASLEHYMFPELVQHACVLTNMRGLFGDVIADHVFGMILCFAHNLHTYVRQQAECRWAPVGGEQERSNFVHGPAFVSGLDRAQIHLADTTLGVVGVGGIGAEVVRRGLAFGMDVVGVDPTRTEPVPGMKGLWRPDRLSDLLAVSDFVVIAAPNTPDTAQLFRRSTLRAMKRTAYLINIGRGAIVNLDDLVAALEAKEIAGCGLDVFEVEPLPATHPLWKMPNVIITPHVAGCSVRIAERHLATLLANLRLFVRGEPLATVVDKERWC